ncbi:hypothetical protein GGI22_006951, partial [Coemansia erecta]
MVRSTKQEPSVQSPTSANAQARSSLGLFASGVESPVKSPGAAAAAAAAVGAAAKSPTQRNVTVTGATTHTQQQSSGGGDEPGGNMDVESLKDSDRRRRRAARRQSEDAMHAMRSLDRQYGRRRRLNSDFHEKNNLGSGKFNAVELLGGGHKSLGIGAQSRPSSRGDSRMLFAPALCRPHAETVTAVSGRPLPASSDAAAAAVVGSDAASDRPVATSRRSAHQLMLLAGRMAQRQQQGRGQGRLAAAAAAITASTAVRPRASMPLINGVPHRAPQRTRSQATRKHRDEELSDALTMKSVEIRGGRIVLDNPSS